MQRLSFCDSFNGAPNNGTYFLRKDSDDIFWMYFILRDLNYFHKAKEGSSKFPLIPFSIHDWGVDLHRSQ